MKKKKRNQYDDDSAESGDEDGAGFYGTAFVLPADGCYYFLPGFNRMTSGNAGSEDEDGLSGPPPIWREPADEEEVVDGEGGLLESRFGPSKSVLGRGLGRDDQGPLSLL